MTYLKHLFFLLCLIGIAACKEKTEQEPKLQKAQIIGQDVSGRVFGGG